MANSSLRNMIREMIDEESKVAADAKAKGLTYMKFGRWGKDGKMTHTTVNGKLIPYSKAGIERTTGMKFGRGKNANNMYGNGANIPSATMTEPGVLKRNPDRWKATPADHRQANKPYDALDSGETARDKLVSKIEDIAARKLTVNTDREDVVIPYDEFKRQTGLNDKQLSVYDKYASQWERAFEINPGNNSVVIYGSDHFWEL